ncbi:MAG: macrolide ABC transporter ATP-binding protein [Candidatus Pacebacteria bacterium RIFOXYB1_FULL_39_46]|nr:MAG: macrolide ABC transporter ATP-binding protein [Candidatus Pacebacteria bacterium RIFOXYA1_FULL_38_18]OGJ38090.1 MAG: macrolide ABC transporter ATP-binding protein [Candidatus Pacebacteria bacterium RIFOXYB1_FULL_39_46]OGJ39766.1 MAG: macrolide ABC transporter ATP-binding protein [Candidatus Pacebacteria bacterium RIFOXYC1_FULL_39_21]OGJ39842.1 MAG: macrolide ABC transporter ATP-binding protein [Candidatus Pacebacteria bacterium RIFOXYD1_FULL_39_27]
MPQNKHSGKLKNTKKTHSTILELKNVSKIYQVGTQTIKALDDISLTVKEGEFLSVMGPSGSGKSTFLQVASILATPSSGKILINGKDTSTYNEIERARLRNKEVGFVFQTFNLLAKTSALENVALPLVYAGIDETTRRQKARNILEKLGLGDRLDNGPSQLSGGQQQRVAIARALVNDPAIIFADEPTGNLDSKSGEEVKKILKQLNLEGKTIIMVTHEHDVAEIAKKHISLIDGKIVNGKLKS